MVHTERAVKSLFIRSTREMAGFIFAKMLRLQSQCRNSVTAQIYDVISLALALVQQTCSNSYKNNNYYCKFHYVYLMADKECGAICRLG